MKNLEIIQKLAKIGKVFSKIIFIACIIGAVGSALGLITLLSIGNSPEIEQMLIENDVNIIESIYDCAIGILVCSAHIYLAKLAVKYFENEIEQGTPFTHNLANQMRKLAIKSLIIEIVVSAVCGIIEMIAELNNYTISEVSPNASLTVGITLLILSVICGYGADILEKQSQPDYYSAYSTEYVVTNATDTNTDTND